MLTQWTVFKVCVTVTLFGVLSEGVAVGHNNQLE
jgi:hypothetical protein